MAVRAIAERLEKPDGNAISPGWLAGLGTLTWMAALATSSCCALPVALAGLGATGTIFSGLRLLTDLRPLLLGSAALALLIGWGLLLVRHRAMACRARDPGVGMWSRWRTAALLGSGTGLIGLAMVWEPYIDLLVLRAMRW